MRGVRIPHDLNGQDRFVLGLSVGNLAVLLFGLLAAYASVHLALPLVVRGPLGVAIAFATVAIVWLRPEGRSLFHWAGAAIEYRLSTRVHARAVRHPRGVASRLSVVPAIREPLAALDRSDDEDVLELPGPNPGSELPAPVGDEPPVPVYLGSPQVIVFYSAKGGTGRTTLATEVACLLAARGWYRETPRARAARLDVLLADLDRSSANVSVRIGLAQPTLLDFLMDITASPDKISEFFVRHQPSNLRVLLGSPKCLAVPQAQSLTGRQASDLITALRGGGHHFLLIDISVTLGEFEAQLLERADRIICVVTPTAGAIQDLYRSVEVLRRLGHGPKLSYVANKMRERWDFSEPMNDLGGQLITQIPFDVGFDAAENRHQPYVLQSGGVAEPALLELATFIYPGLQAPGLPTTTPGWLPWFGRRRRAG